MKIKLLIFSLLLFIVSSEYYLPTKYSYMEKITFPQKTKLVTMLSYDATLLFVGFGGSSYNVSAYKIQKQSPEESAKGRKGYYASFGFFLNLSDASGDVSTITSSRSLHVIGVGSADHIYRIYTPIVNSGSATIVLHQDLKQAYGPIQSSLLSRDGQILAVVSYDGNIRFYKNVTVKPIINMTQTRLTTYQNKSTVNQKSSVQALTNSSTNVSADSSTKSSSNKPQNISDSSSVNHTAIKQKTSSKWKFEIFQKIEVQNDVGSILFANNKTMFYVGYQNGSVVAYNLNQTNRKFQYFFNITDTNKKITSLQINQLGDTFVTGSEDTFIRIYKTDLFNNNPRLVQGIYDANRPIVDLSMRMDGKLIIATSLDTFTRIYNSYNGTYLLNDTMMGDQTNDLGSSLSEEGDIFALRGNGTITFYQSCISSINKCSQCISLDTCISCSENYYLSTEDGFCYPCSLFQGCKTCITQNLCTSCFQGYFLNVEAGVCEPCINTLKNCQSCSSKFECTECFFEFKLSKGICQFPPNNNIPVLSRSINVTGSPPKSKNIKYHSDEQKDSLSLKTHKWMITLLIFIIVLCSLIILTVILMTILCFKLFARLKLHSLDPKSKKGLAQEVPTNSQRTIPQKEFVKDTLQQAKEDDKNKNKAKEPISLQPQQKGDDQFKELRP